MRRGVGIAGLQRKAQNESQFKQVATQITEQDMAKMQGQLQLFKESLELFARKYKRDIRKNPEFRQHFQVMCASIGVDPLASNKGFWSELLGVGDFYSEIGIQAIQVCMREQERTGGLMALHELCQQVRKLRGVGSDPISQNDIELAVKKLKVLGNGFNIILIGSKKFVQSIPMELNRDQLELMNLAQKNNYFVTKSILIRELNWTNDRIITVVTPLVSDGMIWIDEQGDERQYWFPSMFFQGQGDPAAYETFYGQLPDQCSSPSDVSDIKK